jgi:hypothetical protein
MSIRPWYDQNPIFAPIKETDKRYVLPYGGSGGGKSIFIAQYLIELCFRDPREKILLVRKHLTDVGTSNFEAVKKVAEETGLDSKLDILTQSKVVRFPNGAKMEGVGMQDRHRLKSIEGPTKAHVEEANELSEEDINEIDRRLRGRFKPTFQIFMTFNPNIDRTHWIRRRYFGESDELTKKYENDTFIHKSTYMDNVFADEVYGRVLSRLPKEEEEVYKYGDFVDLADPNQVIKGEWFDLAMKRDPENYKEGTVKLGVDAARFGDDRISYAKVTGNVLDDLTTVKNQRTTKTAEQTAVTARRYNIEGENICLDTVGLGAGVGDNLHKMGIDIKEFKAGGSPVKDSIYKNTFFEFSNLRSQAWWYIRRLLDPDSNFEDIAIDLKEGSEEAERLRKDLTAPRYRVKGKKEMQVEPKQSNTNANVNGKSWGIKERLGRSTDEGDSVVQAIFVPRLKSETNYGRVL